MIYTTGSIAVSGNTLTGTGTNFTAAGSLIRNGCTVLALTSPAQAFQITSVDSATSLTVTPAASPAIPAGTKFAILLSDSLSVDGLAQDIAETFSMYQRYMGGFADVMNSSGDVTITINGQPVTVPGQKSLAKKGANSDITSLNGLTTAITLAQGGTGAKTAAGARTSLGLGSMATQSSDAVNITGGSGTFTSLSSDAVTITGGTASLGTIETKAGAEQPLVIRTNPTSGLGYIRFRDASENPLAYLGFGASGAQHFILASNKAGGANYAFQTNGTATGQLWQSTSDVRIKKDIKPITNARDVISAITGYTFKKRYNLYDVAEPLYTEEAGILAQELELVAPEAVSKNDFGAHDLENNPIDDLRAVNYAGITPYLIELAKLHEAEISGLKGEVAQLKALVSALAQGA
ncbi:tail fiber domain-containing protein [Kosakonia sp. CFBP8986]|uniref:tail fiber domain-containing protein n=1 Tax=Kosakonia sp. CFBP8986 TaxID=3096524 RepID=UPI002A6AD3DF|nr:tail fiber domain-containing protein [Kosakonia sp. CFBP8986]MDY0890311.1 tail fiber domain-containing protein [Kosakonia sp. CFBP8986]